MKICNKDCFNCPFEDCINDKMDYEDYVESANRDKLAEYQKAYREANKIRIAENRRKRKEG